MSVLFNIFPSTSLWKKIECQENLEFDKEKRHHVEARALIKQGLIATCYFHFTPSKLVTG